MTPEEATALVKSLIPPGPILIGDSEKFCEVLTDTLVAIVTRAVAAERERCISELQALIEQSGCEWEERRALEIGINAIRRGEP